MLSCAHDYRDRMETVALATVNPRDEDWHVARRLCPEPELSATPSPPLSPSPSQLQALAACLWPARLQSNLGHVLIS